MNCYVHDRTPAVGVCAVCGKAVCRECVGIDAPRAVCRSCLEGRALLGFEYRSSIAVGGWPLVHVCLGVDAVTMRPRVARGVIAIGNIAVGGLALGGVACGLFSLGGASIGLLAASGGVAVGAGLSIGGLAIGSMATGGIAVGFKYAIGGVAFGPAVVDGRRCDPAAVDWLRRAVGSFRVPASCR